MSTNAETVRLLNIGEQDGWWCPVCGRVLRKPPRQHKGVRYHSWKCQAPMRRVTVTVAHLDTEGDPR